MGAVGYYLPVEAIFYLTAVLTLPALAALAPLRGIGDAPGGPAAPPAPKRRRRWKEIAKVLGDRRLLIFALCAALFTFSNAAMLPLAGSSLTKRGGSEAALLIAAAIVLPQAVTALLSPWVGALAERRGRRLMLIVGFFTLPVRGLFFAVTANPAALVSVQFLDGIASACFGVLLPLVIADIAGRSGHFNLALGFVGFTIGIGATASTAFAGWVSDHVGEPFAFAGLAYAGLAAALILWALMPETRPTRPELDSGR